jgi:hypothetical protein
VNDPSVPSPVATSTSAGKGSVAPTTTKPPATDVAGYVGGFVAAEGTFTRTNRNHTFRVSLGEVDAVSCELLRAFFGVGHVYHYARRREHYDDEVVFQVRRTQDLVNVIIPFMDEHLPASYKRQQYGAWRAEVIDFWDYQMKRRRNCTIDGCGRPQKGRGVCRIHYYALYGK